jgi:glycosyltransferase involved in cell wall biosynthesis
MAIVDGSVEQGPQVGPEQEQVIYDTLASLGGLSLERTLTPSTDVYEKFHNPDTLEVEVRSSLTLEDYERVTPAKDWQKLLDYAEKLRDKKFTFINATPAGGGVAIMRGPMIHLMRELGIDARWYALTKNEEASKVTKWKFHNVMQDVAGPGVRLTEADIETYSEWMVENVEKLEKPLMEADVLCIDDWQPSGLIPYIKGEPDVPGLNPDAPILFRDHIHTMGELMVTPGTPQYDTWDFLWRRNRISDVDVFATHPKDEFVPRNVPDEKVVFMPATGDKLDDLNRELTAAEDKAGFQFINDALAQNEGQKPIDRNRPYIVLIARFDESKGMPQGMEAYAKARQKMLAMDCEPDELPQFVMLGNGSVDDPSGMMELEKMMRIRSDLYSSFQDDVKIVRVPHNDVAINAVLKSADIALQPSIAEGFESRVTDAILQGVPVIGSDQGGIPLQITEGESGFVINPYDTDQWADRITELMTDQDKYMEMVRLTKHHAETTNYEFTTIPNILNWLHLSLITQDPASRARFSGNRQWVRKMIYPERGEVELAA